ncbi:CRISPR-associated endonuclease Cas3'' [Kitasatospora misakiensis]|uniref:CRISPR-associated endonuclease Cas3 n=1 Tax=Kitasatospora misakiensis TaxID=67330 RepID=A0ABW0XDX0_9ACTN
MRDKPLYAHSPNGAGQWHLLGDHLCGSAELAARFGAAFGMAAMAGYLALVHDVGKGACAWQDQLAKVADTGAKVGIDHKRAGVRLAAQYLPWPLAGVVEGHHGGLRSGSEIRALLRELRARPGVVDEAIRRVAADVPEIESAGIAVPDWLSNPDGDNGLSDVDLMVRMLFSCVIDADHLDTHAHFRGRSPHVRPDADMAALAERFEDARKAMLAGRKPSGIDEIRTDIYEQAIAAADGEQGIYRLHVPTGGGKTLAGAGFGLRHAARNGQRRIIVAVPFISITEQNASVYRRMLGERDVLEHHSSVDLDRAGWARLAAENWDAPFVITTTVQLFESLFSRSPSRMRRLHRLAAAVIVLDEVQALPDRLLVPILSALRGLTERFGTTVLLSSATQPEFSSIDGTSHRHVIPDPALLFSALERVRYEWREDTTLAAMAGEASRHEQMLMVVSTTRDANAVHQQLPAGALHLSTRMTSGHRRETIEEIRTLLAAEQRVRVVSTSLIEAGVDLDFPIVFRAWAPPENLQQAAGRCNREGHLHRGTVVVFKAHDSGRIPDPSYRLSLGIANNRFGDGPDKADPDNLTALAHYSRTRYRLQGLANLGNPIEDLRRQLDFPAVAEQFVMIGESTASVVHVRPELKPEEQAAARAAIDMLRTGQPCGPATPRGLQPHIAGIPKAEAETALAAGHAKLIVDDLVEWVGPYHPQRGIEPPNR